MISRRNFLKLTGGAAGTAFASLLAACRGGRTTAGAVGETPEGQQEAGSVASRGRLLARPTSPPSDTTVPTGLRPLGLSSGRDGLIYVPEGYGTKNDEAPLALVLPIDRCSRRIVPQLERARYKVRYREFDGPHTVPESVAREALEWFTV